MKEKKKDRFLYYFCRLLGITRVRRYLVFPNGDLKRVYLDLIPDIIHNREMNKDYSVVSVIGEPINETMTYYYIKIEDLFNNIK